MIEVYSSSQQDSTVWQPRPSDPELEAEFLNRLMLRLGGKEAQAAAGAAAVTTRVSVPTVQPKASVAVAQ